MVWAASGQTTVIRAGDPAQNSFDLGLLSQVLQPLGEEESSHNSSPAAPAPNQPPYPNTQREEDFV